MQSTKSPLEECDLPEQLQRASREQVMSILTMRISISIWNMLDSLYLSDLKVIVEALIARGYPKPICSSQGNKPNYIEYIILAMLRCRQLPDFGFAFNFRRKFTQPQVYQLLDTGIQQVLNAKASPPCKLIRQNFEAIYNDGRLRLVECSFDYETLGTFINGQKALPINSHVFTPETTSLCRKLALLGDYSVGFSVIYTDTQLKKLYNVQSQQAYGYRINTTQTLGRRQVWNLSGFPSDKRRQRSLYECKSTDFITMLDVISKGLSYELDFMLNGFQQSGNMLIVYLIFENQNHGMAMLQKAQDSMTNLASQSTLQARSLNQEVSPLLRAYRNTFSKLAIPQTGLAQTSDAYVAHLKSKLSSLEVKPDVFVSQKRSFDGEIIEASQRTVNLRCPMTMMRMQHPGKSLECAHTDVFDVAVVIAQSHGKPETKCPLCSKVIKISQIIIDPFVTYLLEQAPGKLSVTIDDKFKVVQKENNRRKTYAEGEVIVLSDTEDFDTPKVDFTKLKHIEVIEID